MKRPQMNNLKWIVAGFSLKCCNKAALPIRLYWWNVRVTEW